MVWTVLLDFQAFLSLAKSLLNFFSFRLCLITSFDVFLGCPQRKLPLTLKVVHLLDQAFSSIPSRWPNHCSPLSCKHCFVLFSFSLVLSSSSELLSVDLTLLVHLTILASFFNSPITFSSLVLWENLLWLTKVPYLWTYSICCWSLL